MPDTTLQLNIVANATSAEQALGKLASALGRVKQAVGKGMNLDSVATGIGKIVTALSTGISEDAVSRLERAAAALQQMKGVGTVNVRVTAGSMAPINSIKSTLTQAADSAKDVQNGLSKTGDAVKDVGTKSGEAEKEVSKLSDRLKELVGASKNVKSGLGQLISQFFRIMKMRAIRYVIREITKSIKEGLDNYKEYSKAIGGDYYNAVTSANDAMLKMKNSIGAALAPAIQMLIPYIQRAVNWFINLMNIVNQFLALLNGQATWSKAVDVSTETFEKTKEGAQGASKAIKELLADWDELNIIQSESGGGGGGVGGLDDAIDYTEMFTEVDKFDDRIRKTVEWIKQNMDLIVEAAKLVGVLIAGWQISTLLGGVIGTLLGWATVGIAAALVFKISTMFDEKYIQTGDVGWLLANVLTTAFGGIIAMELMKKLTKSEGAGYVAISVIMAVSATADLVAAIGNTDISALSKENLGLAIISALKMGTAGTFLAKAFTKMGWGSAVAIGLGVTGLVFGAEVGIKAVIGDVLTGEITEESVIAKVISALTIGAGAFLVAKAVGLEWPMASMTGAAAAALTASVYLMLDLFVGKVQNNNITLDSVVRTAGLAAAAALGFLFLGKLGIFPLGGANALAAAGFVVALTLGIRATIGALTNPEEITASDLLEIAGGGVAAALGAAGFTHTGIIPGNAVTNALIAGGFFIALSLGIQVALKETDPVDTTGIDEQVLLTTAEGALGMALGLTAMTGGDYGIGVLGAGLYATVLLGIRVVKGAVEAGAITTENINAAFGVGTLGGIVTAGALMKAGASIATVAIGGVAGGLAIATGLIAIAAISIALATKSDDISWYGDETLSEKEVRAFVENKMFYADANVNLSLIEKSISITDEEKAKITEDAKKALGTIQAARLSINEPDSLEEMYGQVQTLLSSVKTYARTQRTNLSTYITMVPIIDETGTNLSQQFLTTGLAGWQGITNYMGTLGDQLAQAMIDETTGKLKSDWDVEAVNTIMNKVQKISEAINGTQMTADAVAALKVKTMNMEDLTRDSVEEVLDYYVEFEKQLREGYTKMYTSNYTEWKTMAAIYMGMAEAELKAGNEEMYKRYKEEAEKLDKDAEELLKHLGTSVESSVSEAGAEGKRVIREWLDTVFSQKVSESDVNITGIKNVFANALESGDMTRALQTVAAEVTGIPIQAFEILKITGWEYFTDDLKEQLLMSLSHSLSNDQFVDVLELLGLDPDNFSTMNNEIRQWVKENYDSESNPAYIFAAALDQFGDEQYKAILEALMAQSGLSTEDFLDAVSNEYLSKGLSLEEFEKMYQMLEQYKKEMETGPEKPDISAFVEGCDEIAANAEAMAQRVRSAFNSLNGASISMSGSLAYAGGMKINVILPTTMFKASGGFVNSGEMFIAREAGPELVGRIGSRSAVANNDQIVNSIQGGVEAGMRSANDGTDQLLGQAVALLSQILRKTGTMQPSAAHGRVIKQSMDMYARSGG